MVSQNSCLPVKFYKISCIAYAHETNLTAYEVSVYNAIVCAVGVVPAVRSSKYIERVCPRRKSGTPVKTGRVVSGLMLMSSSIFAFCLSSKVSQ